MAACVPRCCAGLQLYAEAEMKLSRPDSLADLHAAMQALLSETGLSSMPDPVHVLSSMHQVRCAKHMPYACGIDVLLALHPAGQASCNHRVRHFTCHVWSSPWEMSTVAGVAALHACHAGALPAVPAAAGRGGHGSGGEAQAACAAGLTCWPGTAGNAQRQGMRAGEPALVYLPFYGVRLSPHLVVQRAGSIPD